MHLRLLCLVCYVVAEPMHGCPSDAPEPVQAIGWNLGVQAHLAEVVQENVGQLGQHNIVSDALQLGSAHARPLAHLPQDWDVVRAKLGLQLPPLGAQPVARNAGCIQVQTLSSSQQHAVHANA